jgi:hypothetical protein
MENSTFDSDRFELELIKTVNGRAGDTTGSSFVKPPFVILEIPQGFAQDIHTPMSGLPKSSTTGTWSTRTDEYGGNTPG